MYRTVLYTAILLTIAISHCQGGWIIVTSGDGSGRSSSSSATACSKTSLTSLSQRNHFPYSCDDRRKQPPSQQQLYLRNRIQIRLEQSNNSNNEHRRRRQLLDCDSQYTADDATQQHELRHELHRQCRRTFLTSVSTAAVVTGGNIVFADDAGTTTTAASAAAAAQASISGESLKLFNEGRALESQGNIAAAQRLYQKVTQIAPQYIYGWSNLGNTQTSFGDLISAEQSYNTAIALCQENIQQTSGGGETSFGVKRCNDLYIILLNRGCLLLNTGKVKEALRDLQQSEQLRGRPDAIVLQNLARAYELNGNYETADTDYNLAISMTSNEVSPFWLRSAMVKFQLGNVQSGYELLQRVLNRFPEAPEVRAATAVFLLERNTNNDMTAAQQKFLEIPNVQRLKYSNREYVTSTIGWPPAMIERLNRIIKAVGDDKLR